MRGSTHTFAPSPAETSLTPQPRRALARLELIVFGVIILLLVAIFQPGVHSGREPDKPRACKNNLKAIGLALHNYRDDFGTFPPAVVRDAHGRALHSWRTLLLPYLDEQALYEQIDLTQAWDAPRNQAIGARRPHCFRCPTADLDSPDTTYLAVVDNPDSLGHSALRTNSTTVVHTRPGTRALLVIEAPLDRAVPWMAPLDLPTWQLNSTFATGRLCHHDVCIALEEYWGATMLTPDELATLP